MATHLTRSSDGKHFLIDAAFGREWVAGLLPVDGSDFILLQSFDRCFNHAQMSPVDPDVALIAQDWWIDVADIGTYPLKNWQDGKCRIRFKNLKTGKAVDIVTAPLAPSGEQYSKYHVHPHPQFCANDRLICYTTTVNANVDVAIVETQQLIDRTA